MFTQTWRFSCCALVGPYFLDLNGMNVISPTVKAPFTHNAYVLPDVALRSNTPFFCTVLLLWAWWHGGQSILVIKYSAELIQLANICIEYLTGLTEPWLFLQTGSTCLWESSLKLACMSPWACGGERERGGKYIINKEIRKSSTIHPVWNSILILGMLKQISTLH